MIVLSNVSGLRNRGVEALVRSALEGFARHLPGEPTTVLTSDLPYDRIVLEGTTSVVADWPAYFRSGRVERYLRHLKATVRPSGSSRRLIEILKSATAVVASGGDVFSSDYMSLRHHIGQVETAQAFGRPTIFLAHSIGPFKTRTEAAMARAVLDRAALITVRESRTLRYVVEHLRIPADRVHLTADVAFLLTPSPPTRIAELKRRLGLVDSGYVAVAPSEAITSFRSTRDHFSSATARETHDRAWLKTMAHILASSTDDILIVPHVQVVSPTGDDRRIASRLIEAIGFNPRVRVAWGELSASDFKGLIQGARYLIGERMHACIAALSTAVPTIAVGYSVKAQGIMEDLLGPNVDAQGFLIPVTQFVASDGLRDEIGGVLSGYDEIHARLTVAASEAQRLAEANFIAMKNVLHGRVEAAA
jgi:polysaccharide pyruvyl transferase WcaK-like protein